MIQTQTFDFKDCKDEIALLHAAIDLIDKKQYQQAIELMVRRCDQLTKEPKLKLYDQANA